MGLCLGHESRKWGFKRSSTDARVIFKTHEIYFIILVIVMDDLLFASKSKGMIEKFKKKLADNLDVKIFVPVSNFLKTVNKKDSGWYFDYSTPIC